MKVTLVFPPHGFTSKDVMPHLGLAYLAAVLEKNDIEVEILDAQVEGLSWKDLGKKYLQSKSDIVGITSLTEMRFQSFKAAEIAKKTLPGSIVIIGGPHASLATHDTLLNVPSVDIIVRGEGEYTLLETCKALENNEDLKSVKGISYRENVEIIHNDPRPLIKNLDTLPFPAYHLLPIEKYNFKLDVPGVGKLSCLNVITSRGCPIGCAFCATSKMLGKKWRARSPSNVLDELEYLIETYGIKAIWFYDDTFTMNKKRVIDICDGVIDRGLDIKFTCSIRVDTVDKELLSKMKEAGCYSIFYGVESGSQRILDDIIEKKISIEQIKRVSNWLNELEILNNPSYIASLPDETNEEVYETINLMHELGGKASFSFLKIYPGTRIEEIAMSKGILPKDFSWAKKSDMREVFSLHSVQGDAPIFIDKLSLEELVKIGIEWAESEESHEYSLFKRALKSLKEISSIDDLKRLLIFGKVYLKYRASKLRRRIIV
jgi:radical SAM superfamily enzyme YgiQ (UPF0313 family)